MLFPRGNLPDEICADRVAEQNVVRRPRSGDLNARRTVLADDVPRILRCATDCVAAAANDHTDPIAEVQHSRTRADEVPEDDVAGGIAARDHDSRRTVEAYDVARAGRRAADDVAGTTHNHADEIVEICAARARADRVSEKDIPRGAPVPAITMPAELLNPMTLPARFVLPPIVFDALPMFKPILLPRFAPAALVPKSVTDDDICGRTGTARVEPRRTVEAEDVGRAGRCATDRISASIDSYADGVAHVGAACARAEGFPMTTSFVPSI